MRLPRDISTLMNQLRNFIALLAIVTAVAACGGAQVTVKNPTIPEPLIDKLPLKVGARYPENFDHYIHEELVVGKEKWSIDLGAANKLLFSQLFSSMFTDFQVVDAAADPNELGLDALIEPAIDAFEFSVPKQSQTEEFAVWIRYRIKIYDGDGNQIANWPISAYGKSQTTTFGGDEALRRAAVLAMRDAAALVIMQMDKATGISKLSAMKNTETTNTRDTATMPGDDTMQLTAAEESSDDQD